jgi:hypothetical protein
VRYTRFTADPKEVDIPRLDKLAQSLAALIPVKLFDDPSVSTLKLREGCSIKGECSPDGQ